MSQKTVGALIVAASAAGFATLAIFIKFAYAAGVTTATMLTYRFILGSLMLWVVIKARKLSPVVDKKTAFHLFLLGTLGYGTMSQFFASSLHYVTASLAAMLLYTYPAMVSLLSFAIGDEQFSWKKGIALTICFTGLCLVLGISFEGVNPLGILLGLSAAAVYSCYIVAGSRVLKKTDPVVATAYVCVFASIVFFITGIFNGSFNPHVSLGGWLPILGMAVFGILFGVLGLFCGMPLVGPTNASIISTLEPVITVLLAVSLLGESMTPIQAFGGALILTGVLVLQLWASSDEVPGLQKETEHTA